MTIATGLYADRLGTIRAPLERRLADALADALDLLAEHGIELDSLRDVLGEAEAKYARQHVAAMEVRHG